MNDNAKKRLYELGNRFKGRMEQWKLNFALEYIIHNEIPLAFDTLCTYLYEDEIKLQAEELDEIMDIATLPHMELHQITKVELAKLTQ